MAAADIALTEPIEQEVVEHQETPVENEVTVGLGSEEVEQEQEVEQNASPIKRVNDVLTKLKAEFPNESKELRSAYNSWQQISKIVKSPEEAQQLKDSLEALGGAEGITALQNKAASVDQIDEGIATGNTQLADDIFSDPAMAKGFGEKILPYSLNKLQENNPKLYESVVRPHAVAAMESAGLGNVLSRIYTALNGNKLDDAKELLKQTYGWLEDQKAQAEKSKPSAPDPERLKLENDRKQFEQQRNEQFKNDVNRDVLSHRDTEIEKTLAPYLKIRKLAPETKEDLVGGIRQEVKNILMKDQSYVSQTKAHFANPKRDKGQITSYMRTKVEQTIPQAVEAVWKRRGYGALPKAGKPTVNPGAPVSTKTVLLSKKPSINEVDKTAKNWMESWMAGKATMAAGPYKGRQVKWISA